MGDSLMNSQGSLIASLSGSLSGFGASEALDAGSVSEELDTIVRLVGDWRTSSADGSALASPVTKT